MKDHANPHDVGEELNDSNLVAQSFLVINPKAGAFGLGATLSEAIRNCKREAGRDGMRKQSLTVIAFTCFRAALTIEASVNLSWQYPVGHRSMRFVLEA